MYGVLKIFKYNFSVLWEYAVGAIHKDFHFVTTVLLMDFCQRL